MTNHTLDNDPEADVPGWWSDKPGGLWGGPADPPRWSVRGLIAAAFVACWLAGLIVVFCRLQVASAPTPPIHVRNVMPVVPLEPERR